ncbi:hypothetical protein V1657_11700 [Clostridium perfringens]|uniref:hypothetical protein n=1 Tax=Clostridium perfringens TaxID=1502 RepID=UPI002ED4051D|nr:hypothetical protein V1657_11700 [Clostridium perfringens]
MNKNKIQNLIDVNIGKVSNDFLEVLNKELSDFENGKKTYNQVRENLGLPIINNSNANKLMKLTEFNKSDTNVQPPIKPIKIKVKNAHILVVELKKLEELKIVKNGDYKNLEIEIE